MFNAQHHQQKPWTLSLRAKARNLDFKFRASRILPVSKLFQFSFRFKIHPYLLEIKSSPRSSFLSSWKPNSLWFKFLQIFTNVHGKQSNHKCIFRSWCPHKNYIHGRRKGQIWLWRFLLLFATVSCFIIIMATMSKYLRKSFFLWKLFLKAWNYNNAPAPSTYLHQFAMVILNEICQSLGF